MTYCLSLLSCQEHIAAALLDEENILHESIFLAEDESDRLLPQIVDQVLQVCGLKLSDIHLFTTTTGPGRFTSLRIVLSFFYGLSLACNKPLVGMTAFEAMAWAYKKINDPIPIVFYGRRGEVYIQHFQQGRSLSSIIRTDKAPLDCKDIAHLKASHVGSYAIENPHTSLPLPLYLEESYVAMV